LVTQPPNEKGFELKEFEIKSFDLEVDTAKTVLTSVGASQSLFEEHGHGPKVKQWIAENLKEKIIAIKDKVFIEGD